MVYTASLAYVNVLTEELFVKVSSVHIQLVEVAFIGFCSMMMFRKAVKARD